MVYLGVAFELHDKTEERRDSLFSQIKSIAIQTPDTHMWTFLNNFLIFESEMEREVIIKQLRRDCFVVSDDFIVFDFKSDGCFVHGDWLQHK